METRVSTRQTIYPRVLVKDDWWGWYGKTYHVPDKGPMQHGHWIHREAETLQLGVGPGSKRIADILAHDSDIVVELFFPFSRGIFRVGREESPEEPVYDVVTPDLCSGRAKEPAGDRLGSDTVGTFTEERLPFCSTHARRVFRFLGSCELAERWRREVKRSRTRCK